MKIKTSEATQLQLNWLAAKIESVKLTQRIDSFKAYGAVVLQKGGTYSPSSDWSQGGPIIERERINIRDEVIHWASWMWDATRCGDVSYYGPTPLIAALRCYVASKLGDEVDVPDELLGD